MLGSLITIKNIFNFCLENHNPNGYRPIDTTTGTDLQVVHPSYKVWPYNVSDDLEVVLVGRKEKPLYFFYNYYRQRVGC
ncbi:hypothetical protein J1N35_034317, partial [Gossypium stocksii]